MTIRIIYDIEYSRTIPAVLIDSRKGTPLANQIGSVIKSATDAEVAKVVPGVIPYKLETMQGNLVGYIALQVASGAASVYLKGLRPAFQPFDADISSQINTFIISNIWVNDLL